MKQSGKTSATDWNAVRAEFALNHELIEMSAMSMASNPKPVSDAIRKFRDLIDASPHQFAKAKHDELSKRVLQGVQQYFGIDPTLVATTFSTTAGLSQVYGGIRLTAGDEILTSASEHFTTTETLRLRARREGMQYRQVPLFQDSRAISTAEVISNLDAAIRPNTRVLALTWVYSTHGVKLPVADIADLVREENLIRPRGADPLLLVIDGVHGFGVEDALFDDLKCDLFVAGCHKWMFGPRGTGVICGREGAWREMVPILTSFSSAQSGPAQPFIPGGLLAFEHVWAMADAFAYHLRIGKAAIADRMRELCTRLMQGLQAIPRVVLRTPLDPKFSSGIVAFDVTGLSAGAVVKQLADLTVRKRGVSATSSSFDLPVGTSHVRLSPAIFNTLDEIDETLNQVESIAKSSPGL